MQSATYQKTSASSGHHAIPELIDLLSESTPHSPDTRKLESMSLEEILNFDSDAVQDTSDSDSISGNENLPSIDEQGSPGSRSRSVIQDPFDQLALSPRSEAHGDIGFLPEIFFRNFPRASSSDHFPTRTGSSSGESIYEPTRPWPSAVPAPPPRRFYKFWWRGIIRGAHEAARAARLAGAAQRKQ
jgi:hypothetical protein